ncbi:beta-glucosidase [Serinibacter arcticus]|uniref:beta-glucosidase n=1 Tax=Serinibacter arcticus TaxID=1655435 RepID=A0A2U1ZY53_9MICO|nr:glycoside hydrolase family 3 N-terminal domain-containing protein [Serinibacter arcticus]PWD51909.1 beta-glucosidase [Serinibacter arcticus]
MDSSTRKILTSRRLGALAAVAVALPLAASVPAAVAAPAPAVEQPELGSRSGEILTVDGLQFRDLDHSGDLTPYEDWRLTDKERAADLVSRLTLAEKAGLLMHASLTSPSSAPDTYALEDGVGPFGPSVGFKTMLQQRHISTYISRMSPETSQLADQHNLLQELAEAEDWGIPVLISTDPRSGFTDSFGVSVTSGSFTQFPDAIGMGGLDDVEATEAMAEIIREEYVAVGIREALSPQADIATEPRWTRANGTFGSEGVSAGEHVGAYVRGLQGSDTELASDGVATVVKHWVGYGAQANGYDSHYSYGRYATFPGNNFDEHVVAYEKAFEAGAAGIMPTYSILQNLELEGTLLEQVGAGFNSYLLQDLLREDYGFDGVVTSDWAITETCGPVSCTNNRPPTPFYIVSDGFGTPWGMDSATVTERYAKAINAGTDVIGGADQPVNIVNAVTSGLLSEERVSEAAERVVEQKFLLGLFENPYVDAVEATAVVGSPEHRAVALDIQERSTTLLTNSEDLLPLSGTAGATAYLYGISPEAATAAGFVPVTDPAEADYAFVRLTDPAGNWRGGEAALVADPDNYYNLDYNGTEPAHQALLAAHDAGAVTIALPQLSRSLILGDVVEHSSAVLAHYGASDEALLNVIVGDAEPEGTLPFELPSSMADVAAQASDLPNDTADPLFTYRHGLSYDAPAFTDVPRGSQFFQEIAWLVNEGIATGWAESDGTATFRPLTPVARDAMAAFLYRAADVEGYTAPAVSPFVDVSTSNQFYTEIAWLHEAGISTGWENADGTRSFRPLEPIARDAIAAFLYRYAAGSGYQAPSTSPFTDVALSDRYYTEIAWLYESGIATGWQGNDGSSTFQPLSSVKRDAMAAFLFRLQQL